MHRVLFHLYGPLAINSYGLAIAAGLLLFIWLAARSTRRVLLLSTEQFFDAIMIGVLGAVLGGRLLYLITTPQSWPICYALWDGGFSILGSVIGVLTTLSWYLNRQQIPVLPFLDLIALYAPLLQSIARVGCFFAGCCFGKITTVPWAVTYHDTLSFAPLHVAMHPTQLYSALALFGIFLCMFFVVQHKARVPGQLLAAYLLLTSAERFTVDFFRADREFLHMPFFDLLSIHQWIALSLILVSCSIAIGINLIRTQTYSRHEPI